MVLILSGLVLMVLVPENVILALIGKGDVSN